MMRTHLEFRSDAFPPYPGEEEEINPGRYGKRLAEYLAERLPARGLAVTGIGAEDWGWRIDIGHGAFPLWIGCGNYEEFDDGFLCFIEPSKPYVRSWLKQIPTASAVEPLAAALEQIVRESGRARDVRWWDDADSGRA